ncbi:LLM class flavin-dependent oxidoreductase [Streptomyces sp. NBC_00859]|uniref:LLM class flavin-dependent oxidoreductase n=1 Tax=Streptomyces sp. NBC_00859 TaxID=2903682 RepID=UPI003866FF0C|nr:LLM class flavin-dependent oxidoreductase [Streptomyces sp. NBC_00859]
MPVEFVGALFTSDATETHSRTTKILDPNYTLRLARAHEDHGYDRVLVPYAAGTPDPTAVCAYVLSRLERLQVLLAHRPNACHPTVAARLFASLDLIGDGRLSVHMISGGSNADQEREGDFLPKDRRYARTGEYIRILRKAWSSEQAFDHKGEFYEFKDYRSTFPTVRPGGPLISFGGASDAAFDIGGAEADTFAFWGEPLARTTADIDRVRNCAQAAGRTTMPRIQVGLRSILGANEELAWQKAHRIAGVIEGNVRKFLPPADPDDPQGKPAAWAPENAASQRLMSTAAAGERYDRALWTRISGLVGGINDSNALVGTPETVAQALLDYYDLGVEIFTVRGYDLLNDAIDFGRDVIPLVREEVARRDAAKAAAAVRAAQETARRAAAAVG